MVEIVLIAVATPASFLIDLSASVLCNNAAFGMQIQWNILVHEITTIPLLPLGVVVGLDQELKNEEARGRYCTRCLTLLNE